MSGIVDSVKGALGGQGGPAVAQPAVEKAPYITTNTGLPVFDDHNSETLGRRGMCLTDSRLTRLYLRGYINKSFEVFAKMLPR
jgi:hypothetical protein